jgi:hypothetical protein
MIFHCIFIIFILFIGVHLNDFAHVYAFLLLYVSPRLYVASSILSYAVKQVKQIDRYPKIQLL